MVKKINVLHVEDDDDIREICKLALDISDEFHLIQCPNAQKALSVASEFVADVLLLDVMMPEIGGEELLRRLRKISTYQHTPAIFMTARAQESEKSALIESGAIEVIVKPFDPLQLGSQIKRALEKSARSKT